MRKVSHYFIAVFIYTLILGIPSHGKEYCNVLAISDGDTLTIQRHSKKESVRLIGIDTPETRPNERAKKQAQKLNRPIKDILRNGKTAAQFVKTHIKPGSSVWIEWDAQKRDRYGRLLGYVFVPKGDVPFFLNEELLRQGYADLLIIPPNTYYEIAFREAYQEAKKNRRGIWR